jgi:hypothetical protein
VCEIQLTETRVLGPSEFLKGINVHAPEFRDHAKALIDYLKTTPIQWVRIHPLPSRQLRATNFAGVSYLDAISKFAEAGFNFILPIDVGVKENVGVLTISRLQKFVYDESYFQSFRAVSQIVDAISKFNTRVIYGVENEIDTKEWILQSTPTVGWREATLAWLELSVDVDLKFKRLRYILDGIKDAAPDSPTMVNFEADDPKDDWTTFMSFLIGAETVMSKLGILERNAHRRINDYRIDIARAIKKLDVDIIGLDTYPNYFTKIPPKGREIGPKVDEVSREGRKPVINAEFGYTIREPEWKHIQSPKISRQYHTVQEFQTNFFENALASIESSTSQGTFPWVLMLDPRKHYRPVEEDGFTLLKTDHNRVLKSVPALTYYVEWLKRIDDIVAKKDHPKTSNEIGSSDWAPKRSDIVGNDIGSVLSLLRRSRHWDDSYVNERARVPLDCYS